MTKAFSPLTTPGSQPPDSETAKGGVFSGQYRLVAAATCLPEGYLRFEDSADSVQQESLRTATTCEARDTLAPNLLINRVALVAAATRDV